MNESLKDPKSICIEPSGAVSVCWSLSIGNAKKTLLSKIIGEYDWQKDMIIRTLMEEGPLGLLKLPEAQGLRIQKEDYASKCHLCIEIRKALGSSRA